MNEEDKHSEDKERICPSCRTAISVLAVRCRYCGEEVGRPKEQARELTISDLGGESIHHRAASGSVLDALESFRAEEQATTEGEEEDTDADAVVGRRRQSSRDLSTRAATDELPTLDEGNREIASLSLQGDSSVSAVKSKVPSRKDRVIGVSKIVVGLVLALFIGIKGFGLVRDFIADRNKEPVQAYVNQAPQIMRRGGPPLVALEAAMDALSHEQSSENRKIAEDAVTAVASQVNELLNGRNWSLEKLNTASGIAASALTLYPCETTFGLDADVKADNLAYKIVLIDVNSSERSATFVLNMATEVTVKIGETIEDRFVFKSFVGRNRVRVEDKLRGKRSVTFGIGELPH